MIKWQHEKDVQPKIKDCEDQPEPTAKIGNGWKYKTNKDPLPIASQPNREAPEGVGLCITVDDK